MVKLWRTRKNGTKWSNCGALVKMAQNGQNVGRTRKSATKWSNCGTLVKMAKNVAQS